MLRQVPVIPITESVDWFQYDTGSFSGWPTPGNPYAQPSAYNYPDWAQVMLRLVPKKKLGNGKRRWGTPLARGAPAAARLTSRMPVPPGCQESLRSRRPRGELGSAHPPSVRA